MENIQATAKLMGLRNVRTIRDLSDRVTRGLSVAALDTIVANVWGLPYAKVSRGASPMHSLFIPAGTLKRRRQKQMNLSLSESERLARVARVFTHAVAVWDDLGDARLFMSSQHPMLGGETPLEHSRTELGSIEVDELLSRLDHGIPV